MRVAHIETRSKLSQRTTRCHVMHFAKSNRVRVRVVGNQDMSIGTNIEYLEFTDKALSNTSFMNHPVKTKETPNHCHG